MLLGRPHSLGSLVKDFARLDGGHWYRPLSNSLPPFVLWPVFGMEFRACQLLALVLHCLFLLESSKFSVVFYGIIGQRLWVLHSSPSPNSVLRNLRNNSIP